MIRIGKPVSANEIKGGVGTALKAAGIAGMAYGVMCTLGITAEMTSHLEIAKLVYTAVEPVIARSAEIFDTFAQIAGAAPAAGELMPDAPAGVKVATSGVFVGMAGAVMTVAGAKLSEMIQYARDLANSENEWAARAQPIAAASRDGDYTTS